jgi:hypothetical protein
MNDISLRLTPHKVDVSLHNELLLLRRGLALKRVEGRDQKNVLLTEEAGLESIKGGGKGAIGM